MNELLEDVIKTNKKVRDMVEQQRTDLYSKIKRDNIIFLSVNVLFVCIIIYLIIN